ncbi:MAG: hypothetical protein R3C53_06880 [Pirellulaceae bacterium]
MQLSKVPVAQEISEHVSPAWSDRTTLVQPPATLIWFYSAAGGRQRFKQGELIDGTGGLRRSGLLRIKIPADWQPVAGTGAYAIWATCSACTFSSPPQLQRLIPNVVSAQNYETVIMSWDEEEHPSPCITNSAPALKLQLENWLKLPHQQIALEGDKPEPLESSVKLTLRESDGWHSWNPTDSFYHHGPEDRVFVVDRLHKRIIFGDGLTGRIPVVEKSQEPYAKLTYLAGGGLVGNVGEIEWLSKDFPADSKVLQARNVVAGLGGAEADTLAEAIGVFVVN